MDDKIAGDELQPSSFRNRFDSRSPFLFFVLILFLLVSTPLSAWTEETPAIALADDEWALLKVNPEKEAKPESVTIQLRWFHQFQFAGYYAAIEKGFYAEEGLDVSLLEFNPKEGRVAAVLAGKAQYGVGDPVLLKLREEGKPLVVLAQIFQHTPQVLIMRRESGILSPEDLAGKSIMVLRDDMGSAPIQAMIMETLGGLDSVELVPHSYRYEDLIEGSVDAMSAYRSNEPFRMKQQGVDVNIIDPRSYGIDFYGDNLFTTDQELKEHHERAEKVVRATLKGWEYALKHKDEIIQLIRQTYAPALSVDQLRYEAKVIDQMIAPDLIDLGDINPKRYQHMAETYHRLGMLRKAEIPAGFLHGPREHVIDLTPEERAWIKAHSAITLSITDDIQPRSFIDKHGKIKGTTVDYVRLFEQKLGLKINLVGSDWSTALKLALDHEVDGILQAAELEERKPYLNFTQVYSYTPQAVIAGEDEPTISGPDALCGRRVGVLKDTSQSRYLMKHFPCINVVHFKALEQVAYALAGGEIHAVFGNYDYYASHFKQAGLVGFKAIYIEYLPPTGFARIGLRNDEPLLLSIFDKAIAAITDEENARITNRWLGLKFPSVSADLGTRVNLTSEEQAWLKQDHTVRVRVADVAPYLYAKDGESIGIAVDLISAVSKRTGIKFHFVTPSPPFAVGLKGLTQHSGPDLIATLMPTPEREKKILFTKPYISSPRFIFIRDDAEFVSSMENLSGKTVAVIKDYVVHTDLVRDYPDINLLICKNNEDALKAVSSGKATAFIGDLIATPTMINELGLKNLKAAAPSPLPDHSIAMGIRSDWPELRDIMNKALIAIPDEEKAAIINKWSTVKFEHGIRATDVVKWILLVAGGASGIVLILVFWNRSLSKQVSKRTSELVESNMQFRSTFEQAAVGIAHVGIDGSFLRINDKFCTIVEYSREEMLKLSFQDITYPEDLEKDLEHTQQLLDGRTNSYSMEKRYLRKNDTIVWVNLTVSLLRTEKEEPLYFVAVVKDITIRKKAEELLQVSRESYQDLYENAPIAYFAIGTDATIKRCNLYATRILGYPKEELIGKPIMFLYADTPDGKEKAAQLLKRFLNCNEILGEELQMQRADGVIIWVKLTVTLIYDVDGQILESRSIVEDITESKNAGEKLRKSEKRFSDIADNANDVIWEIDSKGKYTYVSPIIERVLGYTPEEILQKHFYDSFHPDDREELKRAALKTLAGKRSFRGFTNRNVHKNGKAVWLATSGMPILDETGEVVGYRGADTDITKRKQAEDALRESEEKFKMLVTKTEEIIYMIAKDGTFLLSEGKGLDKLGLKAGQVVGKSVFELYKNYPHILTEMRRAFNGETVTTEANVNGIYFRNCYTPHKDHDGNIIGLLGLSVNITERKQAERELKTYQERLKALASKLILAEEIERRRIAVELHDHIGQTLAFSRIQVARAKKYAPEGKPATILDEISQSLLNTIREVKGLIFDLSPPLLHEIGLAAAISNWLEDEVGRKNSIMVKFVHSGKEVSLPKDMSSIVFRNVRELLCNVIKHAQATEVVVSLVSNEEELVIIVRDDGIGFDPDGQADSVGIDSGFGLFSVKQQIDDFGGTLEIESSPGKGCKATLTVPMNTGYAG